MENDSHFNSSLDIELPSFENITEPASHYEVLEFYQPIVYLRTFIIKIEEYL